MHIKTSAFELEIAPYGLFMALALGRRRWEGFVDGTGQGLSNWSTARQ